MTRQRVARALALATLLAGTPPTSRAQAEPDGVWAPIPQARSNPSEMLAVDSVHQRMFRFGGRNEIASNTLSELVRSPTPHWVDLQPTGERPPGRTDGTLIYDAANDQLVLFGGTNFPRYYNDVWTFNLTGASHWTQLTPAGAPPSPRALHGAIYDPVGRRMVMFGGDLWALSLSGAPAWTPLVATGTAPAVAFSFSVVYDPALERMLLFGGSPSLGVGRNDTYALSLSGTPTWSQVPTTGPLPALRFDQAMALDGARQRLVVSGGWVVPDPFRNPTPTRADDTWALDLSVSPSTWSRIDLGIGSGDNEPGHGAFVDFDGSRLILAGAPVLRTLTFATSAWQEFVPENTGPLDFVEDKHSGGVIDPGSGRMYLFTGGRMFSTSLAPAANWIGYPGGPGLRNGATLVLDAARRRLLLTGGRDSYFDFPSTLSAETWAFSLDSGTWDSSPLAARFPFGIQNAAAVMDGQRDRVLLYGGDLQTAPDARAPSQDLWELSLAKQTWIRLRVHHAPPPDSPAPRIRASMVLDAARRRLLIYGGQDANTNATLADLWGVRLSQPHPRWMRLASEAPGSAAYPSAVLDPTRNRMLVTGADAQSATAIVHAYDLIAGTWSTLLPLQQAPSSRTHPALVFDAAGDRLVMYGGLAGRGPRTPGEIWGLSFGGAPAAGGADPGETPISSGWHRHGGAGAALRTRMMSSNPIATRQVSFAIDSDTAGEALAEVFDVAGRIVAASRARVSAGATSVITLDARSLAPGLYLIRVAHGAAQTTHRVVLTN